MFPQRSSKVLPTLVSIVAVVFLVKNPVAAAHAVTQVIDAISAFVGAL